MLEMRPLASLQLSCFGHSGSRNPAFIAELVQMSAEEGGLGKGSSGVRRLGSSGPHLRVLLLPKEDALMACRGAGISFVSGHWGEKEGSERRCLGKISANWTKCQQCAILALTQGCKGLRVPCRTEQPPEAFPSWGPVPKPTCLAFKKQTLSLKNLNTSCRLHLPWAGAGLGHTMMELWDLAEMSDVSEPLVSVTAGAGGTS